ncbi:hypothetical protein TWF281_002203 [Arthrobotrys megalospora]
MKSTLLLTIFAALAAAAPGATIGSLTKRADNSLAAKSSGKRCGGPSKVKCGTGEICASENQFKDDPMGLCIKKPTKYCGGEKKLTVGCSKEDGYYCMYDRSINCVQDANYCGWCIEQKWVDKFGGLRRDGTNRCGGESGKKCFDAVGEFCVGGDILKDGMGICTDFNRVCTLGKPETCGTNPLQGTMYCVKDTREECPSFQDCSGGGICLQGKYVDEFGLKKPTPVKPTKKATPTPPPKPTKATPPPSPKGTKKPNPKPTPEEEEEGGYGGYGGSGGGY